MLVRFTSDSKSGGSFTSFGTGFLATFTCTDVSNPEPTLALAAPAAFGRDMMHGKYFEQVYEFGSTPHQSLIIELDIIGVDNWESANSVAEVLVDGAVVWTWQRLPEPSVTSNATASRYPVETLSCVNGINGKEFYDQPNQIQHVRSQFDHAATLATLRVMVHGGFAVDNVQVRACHSMADGQVCWDSGLEAFNVMPACIVCPPGQFVHASSRSCFDCPTRTYCSCLLTILSRNNL
jgi:hypothetical protein